MRIRFVGQMLRDKPTFRGSSGLARYIPSEYRNRKFRVATGAFQRTEDENHLSINSDEVETINQIAQTYALKFESGMRPVAVACPKLESYNDAASKAGITIVFNDVKDIWEFQEGTMVSEAYRFWSKTNNKSHCGVEYVRAFDDQSDFRFAVRISRAAKYRKI